MPGVIASLQGFPLLPCRPHVSPNCAKFLGFGRKFLDVSRIVVDLSPVVEGQDRRGDPTSHRPTVEFAYSPPTGARHEHKHERRLGSSGSRRKEVEI
jgi:hypothetical protein